MKLASLSYQDGNWELQNLQLQSQNLIVGKNAVGKSRTLATIDLLVKMLAQKRDLSWSGRWEIGFVSHSRRRIELTFTTQYLQKENDGKVTAEKIVVDGTQVLFRHPGDGAVSLWNQLEKITETVYPPENKLTLHTNRDVKKYPYLEEIAAWADQSFGFKFGNISPYTRLAHQEYDLLTAVEDVPQLFTSLSPESRESVIKNFNSLAYNIETITVQDRGDTILLVKEEGLPHRVPHFRLSQGMFRSLAVIIYMEYLISRRRPATIVIDDLCEGLDAIRATKLGRLIFDTCQNTHIQLIATSNDNFLMEVVDIESWNILQRKGKTVTSLNAETHPDLFEKFRYTGLSNFDFFSSDFIEQHIHG